MGTFVSKYAPLDDIVTMFMDQYDKSEGDRDRFWKIGMRGCVELNYEISAEPKTTQEPVQPNKTVFFPNGCLSWTKLGLIDAKGQISTLKINTALTTLRDLNPLRLNAIAIPQVMSGVQALPTANAFLNYYNNGSYDNYFGIGGGLQQYGECRVDEKNRVVIMPADFPYSSILFECISSPEMDPDFTVDLALQESIIAFIAWKLKLGTAQEFYAEAIKSRRRLPGKKITLQQVNQVIRESSGGYLHA